VIRCRDFTWTAGVTIVVARLRVRRNKWTGSSVERRVPLKGPNSVPGRVWELYGCERQGRSHPEEKFLGLAGQSPAKPFCYFPEFGQSKR
jgi:hypothetical protein